MLLNKFAQYLQVKVTAETLQMYANDLEPMKMGRIINAIKALKKSASTIQGVYKFPMPKDFSDVHWHDPSIAMLPEDRLPREEEIVKAEQIKEFINNFKGFQ